MTPEVDEDRDGAGSGVGGGVDGSDRRRRRCSCLPFCFWRGASSGGPKNKPAGAPANKRGRRGRFRLRPSWLITWPWFGKKKGGAGGGGDSKDKGSKQRRGRRLLLLLTTSLQPKKALASVVSGDSALLPAKVSSFAGDGKKKSNRKPRPTVDDDDGPSGSVQPQASTTAATGWSTEPARSRTEASQPSPRATDGPGVAGRRMWQAPLRQHSSFHGSGSTGRPGGAGGLWTAATTLGVIVFFGRATAVIFLCSCLYGARFVRGLVGGAKASSSTKAKFKNSGVAGGSSIPVGVAAGEVVVEPCATEECKKKVVMAGLLDRAGKTPSSRFSR